MDRIYLVQRMNAKKQADMSRHGVDRHFRFDYMGSAEFEFGSLPRAVSALRGRPAQSEPLPVEIGKHAFWFCGDESQLQEVRAFISGELFGRGKFRLKEATYLPEALGLSAALYSSQRFDGWFCIDEGFEFALFLKKDHANNWLDGLRDVPPKTSRPSGSR